MRSLKNLLIVIGLFYFCASTMAQDHIRGKNTAVLQNLNQSTEDQLRKPKQRMDAYKALVSWDKKLSELESKVGSQDLAFLVEISELKDAYQSLGWSKSPSDLECSRGLKFLSAQANEQAAKSGFDGGKVINWKPHQILIRNWVGIICSKK